MVQTFFDYDLLHKVTKVVVNNLNKVIDVNFYPTDKTKISNLLHRPIGLGIQGLADVYALLNIPFQSENAKEINIKIFETMYHASVQQSMEIARERMKGMHKLRKDWIDKHWDFADKTRVCQKYIITGHSPALKKLLLSELEKYKPIREELTAHNQWNLIGSYSSFENSPTHKGKLQYDLWNVKPSNRYNWETLKFDISQYGLRNSLLISTNAYCINFTNTWK